MNYKVIVSEQAERSIMPKRYRVYPLEPWLSREVRSVAVGNYVMFYLVKDAESEVWITRIVYGKRDMKKIL